MKHSTVVLVLCLLAILVGIWFILRTDQAPILMNGPVSFEVIGEGSLAVGMEEQKNYRVQTQEEFDALWVLVYGEGAPPAPKIDFAKEEVLAVFSGTQPTGGYSISVKAITDEDGARHVAIVHETPDDSCMVTEAETRPFEIVRVPRAVNGLTHTDEMVTVPCAS